MIEDMKKQTRGRKTIPILESIPYSNIIFLISLGINYPEAISKARKTNSSSTVKQLAVLRKTGFLNEPKKEKLLNKTRYSVNFDKILEEYLSFCLDTYENDELNFSDYEKLEIVGNAYLRILIECFCTTEPLTRNSTLTNIFERTSDFILAQDKIVRDLESQNNSMKKFIQLLREIGADSLTKQEEFIIKKFMELF